MQHQIRLFSISAKATEGLEWKAYAISSIHWNTSFQISYESIVHLSDLRILHSSIIKWYYFMIMNGSIYTNVIQSYIDIFKHVSLKRYYTNCANYFNTFNEI